MARRDFIAAILFLVKYFNWRYFAQGKFPLFSYLLKSFTCSHFLRKIRSPAFDKWCKIKNCSEKLLLKNFDFNSKSFKISTFENLKIFNWIFECSNFSMVLWILHHCAVVPDDVRPHTEGTKVHFYNKTF